VFLIVPVLIVPLGASPTYLSHCQPQPLARRGAAILGSKLMLRFIDRQRRIRTAQLIPASWSLGLGGLLSVVLTVRYQWEDTAWYLHDDKGWK